MNPFLQGGIEANGKYNPVWVFARPSHPQTVPVIARINKRFPRAGCTVLRPFVDASSPGGMKLGDSGRDERRPSPR